MRNNLQVTLPRHRENSPFMEVSMLCPGISQNTKLHHLTLYKGQVWKEKSYPELCNQNVLHIAYSWSTNFASSFEKNGELHVPPVPSEPGFINDDSQIPWDSEILESFAQLTDMTNITFHYIKEDVTSQIQVGSFGCGIRYSVMVQCAPPTRYTPWYIWTKEGFKIKVKMFRSILIIFVI